MIPREDYILLLTEYSKLFIIHPKKKNYRQITDYRTLQEAWIRNDNNAQK